VNGGLSPESHSVLLCLLEKKVDFKQVKVSLSDPNEPASSSPYIALYAEATVP
jgi:hypothetical protein